MTVEWWVGRVLGTLAFFGLCGVVHMLALWLGLALLNLLGLEQTLWVWPLIAAVGWASYIWSEMRHWVGRWLGIGVRP